jgi:hypothetical protein
LDGALLASFLSEKTCSSHRYKTCVDGVHNEPPKEKSPLPWGII